MYNEDVLWHDKFAWKWLQLKHFFLYFSSIPHCGRCERSSRHLGSSQGQLNFNTICIVIYFLCDDGANVLTH